MDLFDPPRPSAGRSAVAPLAERARPRSFDEVVGIPEVASPEAPLRRLIESGHVPSMVLWGPPGTGKTTVARLVAQVAGLPFAPFSAVTSGVKEVRASLEEARRRVTGEGRRTLLFVDEIHHFNKSQQDAFLPVVEDGTIVLVGATIENPSFYLNRALLSRVRVVQVGARTHDDLVVILARALTRDEALAGVARRWTPEALGALAAWGAGDARRALTLLEQAVALVAAEGGDTLDEQALERVAPALQLRYDRSGDDHYDWISAFIKSVRGSDPDAAVLYLARMLEAGEDPLFLARRLVILASEDVGNADPRALQVAVAGVEALRFLGMPEGALTLAQVTTYLASVPKSNASYLALQEARKAVRARPALEVPRHLRNAPTALMKAAGNAEGYVYPHDRPGGVARDTSCLPDELAGVRFYRPTGRGFERRAAEYLAWVRGETARDAQPAIEPKADAKADE